MEVHAHAHSPRRKWTHYFWEFFMLFMAVTLGFFVENQREHYIEKVRAKQFAFSLIEDLKADTSELRISILTTNAVILSADSLLSELDKERRLQNDTIIQTCNARLIRYSFYDPQLGTYEQVKNSGSLRYFKNEIVIMLNRYETFARYIVKISDKVLDFRNSQLLPKILKVQNTQFLNSLEGRASYTGQVFLQFPVGEVFQEWYAYITHTMRTYNLIVRRMQFQEEKAVEIIELLKTNYKIK